MGLLKVCSVRTDLKNRHRTVVGAIRPHVIDRAYLGRCESCKTSVPFVKVLLCKSCPVGHPMNCRRAVTLTVGPYIRLACGRKPREPSVPFSFKRPTEQCSVHGNRVETDHAVACLICPDITKRRAAETNEA